MSEGHLDAWLVEKMFKYSSKVCLERVSQKFWNTTITDNLNFITGILQEFLKDVKGDSEWAHSSTQKQSPRSFQIF